MKTIVSTQANYNTNLFENTFSQSTIQRVPEEINSLLRGLEDIKKHDQMQAKQTRKPYDWI